MRNIMRCFLAIAISLVSLAAIAAETIPTVHVQDGKRLYNTGLYIGDFKASCLEDENGTTSVAEPTPKTTVLTCEVESDQVITYTFQSLSSDKTLLQSVVSNKFGSFEVRQVIKLVSKQKSLHQSQLPVFTRDIYSRVINTDRTFHDFLVDCHQGNGSSNLRESPTTLVFSCRKTLDFVEHPRTKPETVTFTHTFTNLGGKLLLESVRTSRGQKFSPEAIDMFVSALKPTR